MKTTYKTNIAILLSLLSAPIVFAQQDRSLPADIRAESAEMKADAKEAALDNLNREIDRLDEMADNAPTSEEKSATKARIATLKERRSELRKDYAQARYDALKADVKAEYARVSNWTKRTFTNDEANSRVNDLSDYKSRPTDSSKSESKAALNAVEKEINRLEESCKSMPKGEARKAAEIRIKSLEKRHDQLEGSFNKASFDALVDDVNNEWNHHKNQVRS